MDHNNLIQATLCLLVKGDPPARVLLGYKKIGFGRGKYTGFGGKVEPGEGIQAAALREMYEETGVSIAAPDLHYAGRLAFLFPHRPAWSQVVHVFLARAWSGEPSESDEMMPSWFDLEAIPYGQMWQDGAHWLPPILAGQRVEAEFIFQADNEHIAEVQIRAEEML